MVDQLLTGKIFDRILFGIVGAMITGSIAWVGANQRFIVRGTAPWDDDKPDVMERIEKLYENDEVILKEFHAELKNIGSILQQLTIDVELLKKTRM